MDAVVQDGYGTSDILRARAGDPTRDRPRRGARQVRAAGLDRGTWHLMEGKPRLLRLVFGLRTPKQPVIGRDVAGTVVEVGSAVTSSPSATRSSASRRARSPSTPWPARTSSRAARPNLTCEQAAAVPVSAAPRYRRSSTPAGVTAGQQVLVIGASGGVGVVCRPARQGRSAPRSPGWPARPSPTWSASLGADHVLDYARDDFADGSPPLRPHHRHRRALRPRPAAARAHPDRHRCARRRRGRRRLDRRHHRPAAASPTPSLFAGSA